MIPLFDLHCDTLCSAFKSGYSLFSSPLHISFDKCKKFSPYAQVMAIWTDSSLNNEEGFHVYKKVLEYARNQGVFFSTKFDGDNNSALFISVEDVRIIGNDLSKIDTLFQDGVKIITPIWKDTSQIGGAWNTNIGLSPFGKIALSQMIRLGITIDVSHSSIQSFYDILEICEQNNAIPIATHSCSHSVCNHKRNLTDEQFKNLLKMNACVGISLAPEHLSRDSNASIKDILKHIDAYLCLGGENNICLGCDFDGVSSLPNGISGINDLDKLYYETFLVYGETVTDKIFYRNFANLATKIFN